GKELAAKLIHRLSVRRTASFVAINCGAIPSELMESEFFGHKKGAFTGAVYDKTGLFEQANGGTLFLDEVADLPLAMQVKLLRVLQEKKIRPIGSHSEKQVDVRVLCATHKDLADKVKEGEFREDLFYRLNVIELVIPPLRERRADLPLLIEVILQRLAKKNQLTVIPKLSQDALFALSDYPFDGNIRELENILERALTWMEQGVITESDLMLQPVKKAVNTETALTEQQNLEHHLELEERQLIEAALESVRWNKTKAAKKLGISFRALRYRLKKLGID
ncbi:MAG TPA: sigma-54-dependent Fis family transcriptional regulator, partial [Gammaproteobacteria bacterium]|nr:sigma-54-dependent Fis family transcriptional regulator [Gammaproteobacteria bacterium]